MIRPTKYLDLDACVLNVAAHILSRMSAVSVVTYDEMLKSVETTLTPRARNEFVLALDLLYLLGKISYQEETDTLCAVLPEAVAANAGMIH
jgi:hypothetical protein